MLQSNQEILDFHCPRFNELPKVDLYKEQVITYIEEVLKPITFSDERVLTPTMINNYVKQRVVYPPKDKKYNEKHIAYLIVVCILKHIFSLNEICELIQKQIHTCSIETAYDLFCNELEKSVKVIFTTRDFSELNSDEKQTVELEVLRSSVRCYANKLFIQNYLKSFNG